MFDVFYRKATELNAARRPFALAMVVRHEPPISGKSGDKAIILADGSLYGWIGGGCTKPLIIEEARLALADGKPRLVRIAPAPDGATDGIIEYTMTCHSGGALDIYIEPVLPKPQLILFGRTEVAQTLARLGAVMNYQITVAPPEDVPPEDAAVDFPETAHMLAGFDLGAMSLAYPTFAIVATQGERDEAALTEALAHDLPYVAFVASRKKAATVLAALAERGLSAERLAQVRTPAGLNIGARLPEEIAVSVLAEVIEVMRRTEALRQAPATASSPMASDHRAETLHLGEMHCAHCVLSVRKTLDALDGVTVHNVDIGTATISYDPAALAREAITDALARRGYPVVS